VRDLLIIAIVGLGALMALARPSVGIMVWTWLSIMNPHRYAYGMAFTAPLAAATAGATLLGLLFTRHKQSPFQGAPVWWLLAFAIWVTISWRLGFDPVEDYEQWDKVIKVYLMTLVALSLLTTRQNIMVFAWITVGSLAVLAAKGGFFTVVTGGSFRVWGPPGTFIEDNNHFALATIMTVPMVHFLQLQVQQKWARHALTAVILLCIAAALGSQSRGALLGLVSMCSVFWWRSRNRLQMGALLFIAFLLLLPMMPETWWSRMDTISTYEQDASAMGRVNAWHVAWQVALHHLTGGGMSYQYDELFALYGPYESIPRAAHSIYFQVLGNHGLIGLFLFLMIWISCARSCVWLRKNAARVPGAEWARDLGSMVQVSLVGYAVGGAFLSMSYFDLPYNFMIMVVLARKWVKQQIATPAVTDGAPPARDPRSALRGVLPQGVERGGDVGARRPSGVAGRSSV
jgi:putative inorganic carbon (hco3(-)) transporter